MGLVCRICNMACCLVDKLVGFGKLDFWLEFQLLGLRCTMSDLLGLNHHAAPASTVQAPATCPAALRICQGLGYKAAHTTCSRLQTRADHLKL